LGAAGAALVAGGFDGSLQAERSEINPRLSATLRMAFLGLRLPVIGYRVSVTALFWP
jgi:hypothetical protein